MASGWRDDSGDEHEVGWQDFLRRRMGDNGRLEIKVSPQLRKKNVPISVATLLESSKPLEQHLLSRMSVLQTHLVKWKLLKYEIL